MLNMAKREIFPVTVGHPRVMGSFAFSGGEIVLTRCGFQPPSSGPLVEKTIHWRLTGAGLVCCFSLERVPRFFQSAHRTPPKMSDGDPPGKGEYVAFGVILLGT